ncbi:RNA-directed DNA polymerase [Elizabethkingia miricola]|uniref:reverse transcriptase family protein n=1 Tax=Elizabethkingia bruuniana TaxID=1756149 RepID=UPI00099AFF42|nr:reverse transcriptase family protein [Elizabethkingia bruuniana]OPC55094.1 hypothetical protein BAY07_19700 [Elizabethkingia bruuniana]OPC62487.1 hypothetical protein BAY13_06610 [Elizabethkingia bruuniana]RBI91825.1 RNA-directed DNA polymerase [Elizabethkingia miricola]
MYEALNNWDLYLDSKIKDAKVRSVLKKYVKNLLSNNTVIIFEFNHLSKLLGIEKSYLSRLVFGTHYFYQSFTIPKSNGEERLINAPKDILLDIQRWIYYNILKGISLNDNCVGYREGYSIRNNVEKHLNKEYLLKLDLKDFFPSINIERVIAVFKNLGYTPSISYILASICTLDGYLPQGSPTSPCLSNIIAKRLDARINGLCKKFDLDYSRYADDITISGNKLPKKMISYIENIIVDEGFEINLNKKRLLYKNNQRIITGVSISSGYLTIPKKKKRELRQIMFYIECYGLSNHLFKKGLNDPIYLERIIGYLYFWKFLEPNNKDIIRYFSIIKKEMIKQNEYFTDFRIPNFEFIG